MKFWEFDQSSDIADYNEGDFRAYWSGRSKELLHRSECHILDSLLPASSGWFVDIGAGFGRLAPKYATPGRKVVLIDYAANHLEMAAQEFGDSDFAYVAANAYHLPFRDGVFGGGISFRLFHHMAKGEDFLAEVSRVLQTRASILMTYMNRRSLLRVLRYGSASFERSHSELSPQLIGTHPAFFEAMAAASDLKLRGMRGAGFVHQLTHESKALEGLVDRNPLVYGAALAAEKVANASLGPLKLALMQYALLEKVDGAGEASENGAALMDILMCPGCRSSELRQVEEGLMCVACESVYPKQGAVYDFRRS